MCYTILCRPSRLDLTVRKELCRLFSKFLIRTPTCFISCAVTATTQKEIFPGIPKGKSSRIHSIIHILVLFCT